jgi:hypothetical protein
MTLKELLKAQGLTDDQISKIEDAMKTEKIYTASEENLDVRYGKLKAEHDSLLLKDGESQKLISELQKATNGQAEVQTKIKTYEETIKKQQEELAASKTESALKIGLLAAGAKATDIDYLIYKMNHDGQWKAELDNDGNVKGLDDKLKGLKTQFPNQFEGTEQKKIEENKLPKPDENSDKTVTKEQFKKMGYQARNKLFNENPELYKQLNAKGE